MFKWANTVQYCVPLTNLVAIRSTGNKEEQLPAKNPQSNPVMEALKSKINICLCHLLNNTLSLC